MADLTLDEYRLLPEEETRRILLYEEAKICSIESTLKKGSTEKINFFKRYFYRLKETFIKQGTLT